MGSFKELISILQDFNYSVTDIMEKKNGITITIVPDKKEQLLINSAPDDVDFERVDEVMTHECYPRMVAATKCNLAVDKGIDCDENHKKED